MKPRRGKPTEEEKAARAEERRQTKEAAKASKAASKAAEKESKAAAAFRAAVERGAFALPETGIVMTADLHAGDVGRAVAAGVEMLRSGKGADDGDGEGEGDGGAATKRGSKEKPTVTLLPPLPSHPAGFPCIHWVRGEVMRGMAGEARVLFPGGVVGPPSGGVLAAPGAAGAGAAAGAGSAGGSMRTAGAYPLSPGSPGMEPSLAVCLTGEQWLELVLTRRLPGLVALVQAWRAAWVAPGGKLLVLVVGQREARDRMGKDAARAGRACITLEDLSAVAEHLHAAARADVQVLESAAEAGEYVARFSRAVAEAPYKARPAAVACVTKVKVTGSVAEALAKAAARSGGAGGGAGEDGGSRVRGLPDTWWAMLQTLPGVSSAVATRIVSAYPTLRSLMEAYRDPDKTPAQKAALLANLPEPASRAGAGEGGEEGSAAGAKGTRSLPKMSADVFAFFSTADPHLIVGSGVTAVEVPKPKAAPRGRGGAAGKAKAAGSS